MQDSITTTIMQVGKPMKKRTIKYILCQYIMDYWEEIGSFGLKNDALKLLSSSRAPKQYKLIKRETIETEEKI